MNVLKKLTQFIFFAFVITLPISSFLSVRLLFLSFVFSLLMFNKEQKLTEYSKECWDSLFYLIVLAAGLLYSSDIGTGLGTLETSFGFLAIPFIFFKAFEANKSTLKKCFYLFLAGVVIASLICIVNALNNYLKDGKISHFFFYELTNVIDSHPTYLAYFLIFAITFCLYYFNFERDPLHPAVVAVLVLFLYSVLLLTSGQSAFVSLVYVFSFFVLKSMLEKTFINQKITIALIIAMMIGMFVVASQPGLGLDNPGDSWDRLILWKSSLEANKDLLLGVGTGDYKLVLNAYYVRHDLHGFANVNFNSHNQFLQVLFSNGVLGLIAVIILVARPMYLAFRNGHTLGVLVFFPFITYGLTEVFLGRYQGVAFFAFLHSAFISYYCSLRPSISLKG